MKISIKEVEGLTYATLQKIGLSKDESVYVVDNIIDAELSGRKTHGLVRLLGLYKTSQSGTINNEYKDLDIISETSNSIHINAHNKMGYSIIYRSLEKAIEKTQRNKIVTVGIKDSGLTGYIGCYARKATEKDLIYIGFHNSPGGLIPFGTIKELWGTNPLTIGVPTNDIPVILDMASSQITWGDLLVAKSERKTIKNDVALDKEGKPTNDPLKVTEGGGLLPIAGHKGSGLAFIVELLAGALTGSRIGYSVPGGWGSFYVLIDPTLFRPLDDFKNDVETAIKELKNSPKAEGFSEIYFAGEQSYKKRMECLKNGEVDISEKLFKNLKEIIDS